MGLVSQQWKFAQDISSLLWYVEVEHDNWALTFGEAWRSPETQQIYVDTGRSWTYNSRHLDRLAIDFNLFVDGDYITDPDHAAFKELGRIWESYSRQNKWGVRLQGRQVDPGHFERVPV